MIGLNPKIMKENRLTRKIGEVKAKGAFHGIAFAMADRYLTSR